MAGDELLHVLIDLGLAHVRGLHRTERVGVGAGDLGLWAGKYGELELVSPGIPHLGHEQGHDALMLERLVDLGRGAGLVGLCNA